jgi:hypothetical protein
MKGFRLKLRNAAGLLRRWWERKKKGSYSYAILLNQMSEEGPSDLLVKVLGITFHSTFKNLYYSSMNERGILEGVILQLFTMIIHPVPPDFIRLIV